VANMDLRPLSLGEILDRTFTLYRRNFLLFLGLTALPHLLTLAFSLLQTARAPASPPTFSAFDSMPLGLGGMFAAWILAFAVYLIALGGTVYAVSDLYLGRSTSIAQALTKVRGQFGKLILLTIMNILAIFGALVLFIIPGVYVACRLITSVPAALLEDLSASHSLERSFSLTRDSAGRAFVIYLLYYVLNIAAAGLLTMPFSFALIFSMKDSSMFRTWLALTQVGGFVANVLVGPVLTIAASVFYYDLRVRKEAFDLQYMMNPSGTVPSGSSGLPSVLS
jgi:hypothetical protein